MPVSKSARCRDGAVHGRQNQRAALARDLCQILYIGGAELALLPLSQSGNNARRPLKDASIGRMTEDVEARTPV